MIKACPDIRDEVLQTFQNILKKYKRICAKKIKVFGPLKDDSPLANMMKEMDRFSAVKQCFRNFIYKLKRTF